MTARIPRTLRSSGAGRFAVKKRHFPFQKLTLTIPLGNAMMLLTNASADAIEKR